MASKAEIASSKRMRTDGNTGVAALQAARSDDVPAKMLEFINYSWSPYHAVEKASESLVAEGFQHINERDSWNIVPGGKYFFTRNLSSVVAFAVGKKYKSGNGFYMVGAHTDSPVLKLKPVSKSIKSGYLMVNVEPYGGGLWHTWFDRDLSVAGRLLIREGDKLTHKLVKINKPIMRIPMLAIHLARDISTAGFKPNFQAHLSPVLALINKATTDKAASSEASGSGSAAAEPKHHSMLLAMLAEHANVQASAIIDFDLNCVDVQPGVVGGLKDDFIFSPRLDNLAMSYIALEALMLSIKDPSALDEETGVRGVALFDHEEVGSSSASGAGGPVMRDTITRVAEALSAGEEGASVRAMRSSFLVSADMAHAIHPNYSDKHDPDHQPKMNGGVVIKYNQNQRYATNDVSAVLFREVGRAAGLACQEFVVRNDMPCGSTIGPILTTQLGCRTVDVGVPQLSMHSIREMCGTEDITSSLKYFVEFYSNMSRLESNLDVDSLLPPNILGEMADTPCGHVH